MRLAVHFLPRRSQNNSDSAGFKALGDRIFTLPTENSRERLIYVWPYSNTSMLDKVAKISNAELRVSTARRSIGPFTSASFPNYP